MATDGHNPAPNADVNPESIRQGHEADPIDWRSILYVPIVLLVFFGLAFGFVTLLIGYLRAPVPPEPGANPFAVKRNQEPINERLGRINSSTPLAEIKQPRLEGLDRIKNDDQDPPFMKSYQPAATGNSPRYHPEDLRASSPRWKELHEYAWIKKDEIARIPIDAAMKIVLKTKTADGKPYLGMQVKDGKPVELGQLKPAGPTASNPQGGDAFKADFSKVGDPHGAHP